MGEIGDSASSTKWVQPIRSYMETQKKANPHHVFSNVEGLSKKFIDICLEEVEKEGYQGGSLKPQSWKRIKTELNDTYNLHLDQKNLKNHWDDLKRKYKAWRYVVGKSDHAFNAATGVINWPEQKWEEVIKRYPQAKPFRKKPLAHHKEMYNLFESITAEAVDDSWNPYDDDIPQDHNTTPPQDEHNTTPLPGSSGSSKKQKRNIAAPTSAVEELLVLVKDHFEYIRSEKEAKKAAREAEKAEMECYSVAMCLSALNNLRDYEGLTKDVHQKALIKFVERAEYRKAFMEMVETEDRVAFASALAHMS